MSPLGGVSAHSAGVSRKNITIMDGRTKVAVGRDAPHRPRFGGIFHHLGIEHCKGEKIVGTMDIRDKSCMLTFHGFAI